MEWPLVRLGDVVHRLTNGFVGATRNIYQEDGIPYLLARQVKNNRLQFDGRTYVSDDFNISNKKSILIRGDVLLVQSGHIGHTAVVPAEHEGHNCHAMIVMTPKDGLNSDFLSLFFNYLLFTGKILEIRTGSTVPHLTCKLVKELLVPLPPIPEQQRIVAILDQAFADIEKARANAEKNLKNARELFDSYLNQVFSQRGEGWVERPLSEIADVKYGFTDKATEEGDFRYVRITDIDKNGELVSTDKKYIQSSTEARKFTLCEKDLLMARTGATFAKVLLYRDYEPSIFASYLIKISFKEDIDNEFYWFFSKTSLYWNQANELKSGAAQPHFNGTALKQVRLPYPLSRDEQTILIEKFKAILSETMKLENFYEKKLVSLDELRKSLLQKAFSGELTKTSGQAA